MFTKENVLEKIKLILEEVAGEPSLAKKLSSSTDIITEVGLDSVQMINFVLVLEDEFGIEINFEKLDYSIFNSVDSLVNFICESLGSMAGKK